MTAQQSLVEAVRAAGLVGAGGAGFPTHVKVANRVEYLIINGAECEPLLHKDEHLLLNYSDDLLRSLQAVKEAVGARGAYLALKSKYREAVELWERALGDGIGQLFLLDDYYPVGDEQALVLEVTGRVVPEAGIPLQVDALVINVETLLNAGEALKGRPVTRKYVTVGGAVAHPQTVRVPVGVPYRDLLEVAGGTTVDDPVFFDGGPMMGIVIESLDAPVKKTTNALLAFPRQLGFVNKTLLDDKVVKKRASSSCEICHMCTDLCPRYLIGHHLEPHKVMRGFAYGGERLVEEDWLGAILCCGCGVCELYACPTDISPRRVVLSVREGLLERGVKYPRRNGAPTPHPLRDARRIPTSRLVSRLGIKRYDRPAPLREVKQPIREVCIPLRPCYGERGKPTVRIGDEVEEGALVGEIPEGALGARAHASLAGRVSEVNEDTVRIEAR